MIAPRSTRRDKKRRIRRKGKGKGETRTSYFIASVVQWIEKSPWRGRPKFDRM
jgi:hypothetical protein